jgi:hypothetical protein
VLRALLALHPKLALDAEERSRHRPRRGWCRSGRASAAGCGAQAPRRSPPGAGAGRRRCRGGGRPRGRPRRAPGRGGTGCVTRDHPPGRRGPPPGAGAGAAGHGPRATGHGPRAGQRTGQPGTAPAGAELRRRGPAVAASASTIPRRFGRTPPSEPNPAIGWRERRATH